MASIELDPSIKLCLKYLHSSAADSTENLRLTLDELIRSSHGASKTLGATLPKKYLQEEKLGSPRGRHKPAAAARTVAPPAHSPQQLQIPERSDDSGDELPFDLFDEDLTCAVCRQIAVQAGNRLVECDACNALYHQDCHKPNISDNDMSSGWQCASCLTAQGFAVTSFTGKSHSQRSSPTRVAPSSVATVKISGSSSSSASSSGSKVVTPNINIISADKRLQIMKKKAAKQQEKRKHSK